LSLNGWGSLKVQTNNKFSNGIQMYAGGYLEGCMTWKRIKEHNDNVNQLFFPVWRWESFIDLLFSVAFLNLLRIILWSKIIGFIR